MKKSFKTGYNKKNYGMAKSPAGHMASLFRGGMKAYGGTVKKAASSAVKAHKRSSARSKATSAAAKRAMPGGCKNWGQASTKWRCKKWIFTRKRVMKLKGSKY